MKRVRARLIVPQEYTSALQEVLGIRLDDDYLRTREGKRAIEVIARSVEELSKGLTQERDQFLAKRYLKEPALRKAYALYYTTTNVLKAYIPLKELFTGKEPKDTLRVIDLGAGTGAASLGLLHYLQKTGYAGGVEVTLVDAVGQNLADAAALLQAYSRSLSFSVTVQTVARNIVGEDFAPQAKADLILMMNTLNEIGEEHDRRLFALAADLLAPDGSFVIIEPAARPASRRTLEFRDRAVAEGYTVYAPCTRQSFCPALIDKTNWCHTEIDWQRPKFIEYIDDSAGTLRLSLKYTYVILNKTGETLQQRLDHTGLSRVVSEVFFEKGRTRFILCNTEGRENFILNTRDITPINSDVEELDRYDLVALGGQERREHDIRINRETNFRIVLPKSGA